MFEFLKSLFKPSDRRQTEESDLNEEEFLKAEDPAAAPSTPLGLFYDLPLLLGGILGYDGTLSQVNSIWQDVTGQPTQDLTAQSFASLVHPKDRQRVTTIIEKLKKSPQKISFEFRLLCKNKKPESISVTALSSPQKNLIYLAGQRITFFHDKYDEVSRKLFIHEAITAQAPDVILHLNRAGFVQNLNPAVERITGYKAEELMGKHFSKLPFVTLAGAKIGSVEFMANLSGAERKPFEMALVHKDGSRRMIEVNARKIVRDNRFIGVLGVIRDMEERKQMEEDLEKAKNDALESARIKSEFLANMSHEIRTPLNAVVGMTDLLKDTTLTQDQTHYVETISKSGEGLLQLINDILDFSKMEAGKLVYHKDVFNLRETAEDAVSLLGPRAQAKGLELGLFMPFLDQDYFVSDAGRLRQVMVNLVGNAIKFTDKGEVVLKIKKIKSDGAQTTLRFEIIDTGIGINKNESQKLFQSFQQVDSSASRKYGGTGLGLAISKRIVQGLGGTIGVKSEKGKGSTFWFDLTLDNSPKKNQSLDPKKSGINGLRVLVIDDNATNRMILHHQLSNWDMNVMDQDNPSKGFNYLQTNNNFDLVILDMEMPKMTGLELAKKIRTISSLDPVKIIILSSVVMPSKAEDLTKAGVNAYIPKPVSQSQLYDAIVTAMKGRIESPKSVPAQPSTRHTHFNILIVEDNKVNQELTRLQLKKLGFTADVVENGREALKRVFEKPYSLVFMDCQMPVMDGFDATKEIRRREGKNRHTPIVGLTANALEGDREKCLAAGMDDYLSKPVKVDKLMHVILNWDLPLDPRAEQNVHDLLGDEKYSELKVIYIKNTKELLQKIKKSLSDKDWTTMDHVAHTLKGSSSNMGSRPIHILCQKIQDGLKKNTVDELPRLMTELETECNRTFDRLEKGQGKAMGE